MRLADLRKLAIRKQTRIRFPLKNGMECVINERGVAQVPALAAPPDFNLEDELSGVASFVLEQVMPAGARGPAKSSPIARAELAVMAEDRGAAAAHDEHEEE